MGAQVVRNPGARARRERARQRDLAAYVQARQLHEREVSLSEIARRLAAAGYLAPQGQPFRHAKQVARLLERG